MVLIIFSALSLFLVPQKSIDPRGYEVFSTMSQYGVITNKSEWNKILEYTKYGKNLNNVEGVNTLIYKVNKHSSVNRISADKDIKTLENPNFPSTSNYKSFTIINIPSAYSINSVEFSEKYASKLAELIDKSSNNVILNLSNNFGGLTEPMIIGASALIPDGIIFNEINNKQDKYPVYLKKGKLFGGIPGTSNEMSSLKKFERKKLNKKVAIVTNNNTASAAESLILALKNNPNVKIFGLPSAGYTSINMNRFVTNQNANDYWWFVYTVGYYEVLKPINGQLFFNNQPISPDYYVNLSTLDGRNQDITHSSNQKLFETINNWFKST